MNKTEAIQLLNQEGWTKADAKRALETVNFKSDRNIDELTILRMASKFAGAELLNRQRLQAAQKAMVTKRNKEIQKYIIEIEELTKKFGAGGNKDIEQEVQKLTNEISNLILEKNQLESVNRDLEKDNKHLKNIVDEIKFKLTVEIKDLLALKNVMGIHKRLAKLLGNILG